MLTGANTGDVNPCTKGTNKYLQIYTADEGYRQHPFVILSQALLGHAEGHISLLRPWLLGSCRLACCLERVVLHLQKYCPSVSLHTHATCGCGATLVNFTSLCRANCHLQSAGVLMS